MLSETDRQNIAYQELGDGEKLLWTSTPDSKRAFVGALGLWFFAIPWTAFSVFRTRAAFGVGNKSGHSFWGWHLLFPLWGVPFVFVGVVMLLSLFGANRKAKNTMNAISNKRVLLIESGKTRVVESYHAMIWAILSVWNERTAAAI